jgi:hypothetical protein
MYFRYLVVREPHLNRWQKKGKAKNILSREKLTGLKHSGKGVRSHRFLNVVGRGRKIQKLRGCETK